MKIEKDDDLGGAVLNCAVRYALGRASYMPGLVMDEIRPMIPNLTKKTLWCMERDINEWMTIYNPHKNPYEEEWGAFLKLVQERLDTLEKGEAVEDEGVKLDFMLFSKRIALAKLFDEWADANSVAKTPDGVISFLHGSGLLDVEATGRFIMDHSVEEV